MGSSSSSLDPLVLTMLRGESIIDVGCGYGRWGALITANYWESGIAKKPTIDALDAFQASVNYCSKLPYYRHVWHKQLPEKIKGSWDTVLAIEIIEHIPQHKVEETLDILEGAAKKRIILSTPNWPAFREGGLTDLGYNKYEAHLSYVSRKMLKKRGYKFIGVGFGNPGSWWMRFLSWLLTHKPSKTSKKKKASAEEPLTLGKLRKMRLLFETIPRLFPSQGMVVLAYKDVDKK